MKPVIVFDMNETLLDMSALDPTFAKIFAPASGAESRKKWFQQLLELFMTATITGEYRNFDKLSEDALHMIATQQGNSAREEDRATLRSAQAKLPAHPDVRPGLARLNEAGFTTAVLSNSTERAITALLKGAGISDSIDYVLSADAVRRYKPAPEAYEYAATMLDVKPSGIVLAAAHAWDVAGAMAAGCEAAFISRPGKVLSPGGRKPRFEAGSVTTLAAQLVAEYA